MSLITKLAERGYTAEFRGVPKNGKINDAIVVYKTGTDVEVLPVTYLEECIDLTEDEMVDYLIHVADTTINTSFNFDEYTDFEKIKDKLMLCVGRPGKISGVTRTFYDIITYVRCMVDTQALADEGYNGTFVVNDNIMKLWGITEDELFEVARANYIKNYTVNEFGYLVYISTKHSMYGAAAITDAEIISKICQERGFESCYIIPSSVHEIILYPFETENSGVSVNLIRETINNVNSEMTTEADILSYNPYYFDGKTITVC